MPVTLALGAEPARLPAAERDRLALTLTATNDGDEVVDPELHRTALLVDGAPAIAFGLAVGNGRRDDRWFALPPGESVSMTWSSLGEAVLPAEPGEHELVLALNGVRSAPARVVVAD